MLHLNILKIEYLTYFREIIFHMTAISEKLEMIDNNKYLKNN